MGTVAYRDYTYFYEDEYGSEKLFDYRENIKDFTRIPMHSQPNSIDTLFKEAFGILGSATGEDAELRTALFFAFILVVNRHMMNAKPVTMACVGDLPESYVQYCRQALTRMHPDSALECYDSIASMPLKQYDVFLDMAYLSDDSWEEFLSCKEKLSENSRLIVLTKLGEDRPDGADKYNFGRIDVLTTLNEAVEAPFEDYEGKILGGSVKRSIRTIASICPHDFAYNNYELTKDICVNPYLFFKRKNCKLYMVGLEKSADYPFKKYVEGPEFVELEDYGIESKLAWLEEHVSEIDLLMLFGSYRNNIKVAARYKELKPDGVIYIGLDASAFWINNIPKYEKEVDEFYKNCDIKGTSAVVMQRFIKKKWDMDTAVIRIGYYPFGVEAGIVPDYPSKKKRIVTVSRVGRREKRIDVMMEAFAKAYNEHPDWELRLIGPIEEAFMDYVENFFEERPYLENVITLTGPIYDKEQLHNEFLEASIFALSSESEEFTNAIPEAMSAGCAIISTKVDLVDDITNFGKCGLSSSINDVDAMAANMEKLFADEKLLRFLQENAYENYLEKHDYNKISDKLYELLLRV